MIGSLLTFFAAGLATIIVAGLVLGVVGVVFSLTFGLATFLLFKVAPVLLVGYALPGCNMHAPDEWFSVENYQVGTESLTRLYEELADALS